VTFYDVGRLLKSFQRLGLGLGFNRVSEYASMMSLTSINMKMNMEGDPTKELDYTRPFLEVPYFCPSLQARILFLYLFSISFLHILLYSSACFLAK